MDRRVAFITGASRGIGRAIAERLASDGCHVVLVARSADRLEALAKEITDQGGSAEACPCDIGDGEALATAVTDAAERHGRFDILVNNAGITRDDLLLRMSDEAWDEVIHVNLRSAFVACRAAVRPMMRGRFGRIINVGSVSGVMGNPGQANYAAAKAGMIGFTKTIGKEFAGKGVTANVVAPGFIATDMTDALPDLVKEEATKRIPAKRFGTPEEIAHAVSFLASDGASYINGRVLAVDGGMTD